LNAHTTNPPINETTERDMATKKKNDEKAILKFRIEKDLILGLRD
jgi:hypothetical protein